MGGLNVKNTIVERALQIVAPRPCFGCGKVGVILCSYCKYDIVNEAFGGCILCAAPNPFGVCGAHHSPVERAFVVSERTDTLKATIDAVKFAQVKRATRSLAELLHERLPILPSNAVIVPVPTIARHVRQRGYDQVALITREFATLRHLPYVQALTRTNTAVQHEVGRTQRQLQAETAFSLHEKKAALLRDAHVLLVDDIITTGATVEAAAHQLTRAGATVWVAALAYQPLD